MKPTKLNQLAIAVALLAGSGSAFAVTPWQANDGNASNYGTPDFVIYTSGGAAQDLAYGKVVETNLAKAGTLDVFQDDKSRFAAYYFIGSNNLSNAALRGKKILLEKRSLGAAGYGVVPLVAGINLDHLDIFKPNAKVQGAWTNSGTTHSIVLTTANAGTYLSQVKSDGGFLGVDAAALLKPNTDNYPDPVNEVSTNAPTAGWVYGLTPADLAASGYDVVPTGGLVYGVGVTLDLYKVLQAAQKKTGKLPSSTTIGAYDEASLPSLNRNFIAALLSGQIADWSDVKIVDPATNSALALNDPTILSAAGINASHTTAAGTVPYDYRVAVGRRNTGAAIGAVAYAKFLNYPDVEGSFAPAATIADSADPDSDEDVAHPIVKSPAGAAATGNLLVDWQTGANSSGFNNQADGAAKRRFWGIAVNSADRNTAVTAAGTGGQAWRYVKIDGYAPTLENVAAGAYPQWAEGQVLIKQSLPQAKYDLLKDFANGLGSVAIAKDVNTSLVQAWGKTGIFATTNTDSSASVQIPFNANNPVVSLNHNSSGTTILGIVPTPYNNGASASGTVEIQLK